MELEIYQINGTRFYHEKEQFSLLWWSVRGVASASTYISLGSSGLGKTTFINTLFSTFLKDYKKPPTRTSKDIERTVSIDVVRAGMILSLQSLILVDIEEKGFNVRLTVIDTPGFGDYMNNQDCWIPIIEFLEEQHSSFMKNESGPNRNINNDMRVHVCLYFIKPTAHT